jgi:transposase
MAYSVDLRERMLANLDEETMRRTAKRFRMSLSSVYRIKRHYEETGQLQAKKPRGRLPAINAEGEAWLKEKVAEESDLTLARLCEKYEQSQGRKVSKSAMDRALKRMKISLKKKTFYDPKRESEPVQKKREEYCEEIAELDPNNFIFLDEMGAALDLTPVYGRSPKGTRAYGEKPVSPGTRISTLGAMTMNAMITAMCFEGTLNGQVFLYFLEHFLCPVLRSGHIVIMDNATAHLVEGVRELIETKGARLLYLPPYSPDFNPIELAWSKVKHYLRQARARTVDALYQAISQALDTITADNATGFFKHAGVSIP